MIIGLRGVGAGGATAPPQFDQKHQLVGQFSTQESGNLPYHVKTTCSYLQKSIKKEQFHPQNAAFARLYIFKIFPGEDARGPVYDIFGVPDR